MREMMKRLFRRTQPVKVITENGEWDRHGIVQEIGSEAESSSTEAMRYGKLTVPLYRYTGDAKELIGSTGAELRVGRKVYSVLNAKEIRSAQGVLYIEAVLERLVADDDGQ